MGKTFTLGKYKVNFSRKGIAAKREGGDPRWLIQYPWAQPRGGGGQRDTAYGEHVYYDDDSDERADGAYEDYSAGQANNLFILIMLVLLPPYGIWLIWKRNRYELTTRSAISAASLIWFVILLVWIFTWAGNRGRDQQIIPGALTQAPTPTLMAGATPTPDIVTPTDGIDGTAESAAPASPTFQGGADNYISAPTPSPKPDFAWCTETGKHYHAVRDCTGMKGAKWTAVVESEARGQTACPVCLGNISGNIVGAPVLGATAPKATPKKSSTLSTPAYYATKTGKYYHKLKNCSGMTGASSISPATAVARKQSACPKCVSTVYATKSGKNYHASPSCSGMKGASSMSVSKAKSNKKTACPTCIGKASSTASASSATYYATATGRFYHAKATCSGMRGASKISAATAKARGQKPCPACLKGKDATITYYATATGKYYHRYATCSGTKNASKVSLAKATSRGQTPCPSCLKSTSTAATTLSSSARYYGTKTGRYFHKTKTCSGMRNAQAITLSTAKKYNQSACPKCLGAAVTYYATRSGKYYHKSKTCSGMRGAALVSVSAAVKRGQSACPKCLGGPKKTSKPPGPTLGPGNTTAPKPTSNSQIKVWVTIQGTKYHSKQHCSGMKNAASTTLTWALEHNYKRCTACDAPKPVS